MVNFGFIDTLSVFFNNIRGPLDNEQHIEIVKSCLEFLISTTGYLMIKKASITSDTFSERRIEENANLINTFRDTQLVNIISMLYGMLHKDASTQIKHEQSNGSSDSVRKQQPVSTVELASMSLRLLNQMIVLDLNLVQVYKSFFIHDLCLISCIYFCF